MIVAAVQGTSVKEVGFDPVRQLGLQRSQQLAHLVGVNGFSTPLVDALRTRMRTWAWSGWASGRAAYGGVLTARLEWDRATETHRQPAAPHAAFRDARGSGTP